MKEIEKLNYRPFTRFCMSIGAVPSSYLAGLTIEEQLLWFCSYLEKEVVPVVNNNSEVVQELKDYVEHYFDNLDVQEEIDNKLDEMVEDGTLENLIAEYLPSNVAHIFETVAAMKEADLTAGMTAKTLGYYSANDGGGAEYVIKSSSSKYYETLDNTLKAELIIKDNIIDVACLGLQDNSLSSDCSTKLQNIVDYASTHNLTLYFSANKTYQIQNPIVLKASSTNMYKFTGELSIPTHFNIYVTGCYKAFVGESFPSSFTQVMMYMENINIDCDFNNYDVTFFKGIRFYSSKIINCNFYHPNILLEGAMTTGCWFSKNRVQSVGFCFISQICFVNDTIDYNSASTLATANGNLNNNDLIINTEIKCNDSTFINENYIAGNPSKANKLTTLFITANGLDSDFYISNSWFEFFMYAFRPIIKKGNSSPVYGNKWTSCEFQCFYRLFENGVSYRSFTFNNCNFQGCSQSNLTSHNMNAASVYTTTKCGAFVADGTETDYPYFVAFRLIDNMFNNNDNNIYIVFGNNQSPYNLSLFESGSKNGALTFVNPKDLINIKYASNHLGTGGFTSTYCQSLNNINYSELPTIFANGLIHNAFQGQLILVAGEPYIAVDDGTSFKYQKLALPS